MFSPSIIPVIIGTKKDKPKKATKENEKKKRQLPQLT